MPEESTAYFVASVAVGLKALSLIKNNANRERIANIAARKRVSRDTANHQIFHKPRNVKVDKLLYGLNDSIDLIENFNDGQLTRADAVLSLSRRSCEVGREILCAVAEERYDEAYIEAKDLDEHMHEQESFSLLPMLGVPVSIKDCVHMRGCDSTLGAVARCFKPEKEDGLLVQLLRRAGCIPFVRSNVPQLLLMPESDNAIWGQAKNPYNITRTPGGSSGGEAALIAARCSFLGLGSDIGGSIRIPAHYCGIVGFKPTPGRVTRRGAGVGRVNSRDGQIVIPSTTGPMARSVRDCARMMAALVAHAAEEDCAVPPIGWDHAACALQQGAEQNVDGDSSCGSNSQVIKRKLRVAVMTTDGWFEPYPACVRAVKEAAEALEAAGHEIVPFDLPVKTADMIRAYYRAMGADGNWYSLCRALEGEELSDSYKSLQAYTRIPNFLRPAIMRLLDMVGEHRKALMLGCIKNGGLSVREYWEVIADVKAVKTAYEECFRNNKYDALLMPGLGVTALPHGMAPELLSALSYTFLGNVLSWPAGCVPVTVTRECECEYTPPAWEDDSMGRLAQKACAGSAGLPVGVQVMCPMWQDEKCLLVMSEIEKNVKFSAQPAELN